MKTLIKWGFIVRKENPGFEAEKMRDKMVVNS
jgi:hypothetical protein